jgi:hypothetical protein
VKELILRVNDLRLRELLTNMINWDFNQRFSIEDCLQFFDLKFKDFEKER